MKLLTKEILKKLPPLYANEGKDFADIPVIVKFFFPAGRMTYYATEYDPEEKVFFSYMRSPLGEVYDELGYASLEEMEAVRGPFGLKIERDEWFGEHSLKEVMEKQL